MSRAFIHHSLKFLFDLRQIPSGHFSKTRPLFWPPLLVMQQLNLPVLFLRDVLFLFLLLLLPRRPVLLLPAPLPPRPFHRKVRSFTMSRAFIHHSLQFLLDLWQIPSWHILKTQPLFLPPLLVMQQLSLPCLFLCELLLPPLPRRPVLLLPAALPPRPFHPLLLLRPPPRLLPVRHHLLISFLLLLLR